MTKKSKNRIATTSTCSDPATTQNMLGQNRIAHCVLGFPLDLVTMNDVLKEIEFAARTRQKLFISTANLNFVTLAQKDEAFRNSLRRSNLCVTDGIGVKLIGKLLGIPIPERVAGSDILNAIWDSPETFKHEPLKVFFLGGTKEANQRACDNVNQHKSQKIVSVGNLYPGFGTIEELSNQVFINKINAAKADFLIVALGAEKGQAWILRNLDKLDVPIISHLGATINFLAGSVQRAPTSWQRYGLEWLWRVKEEVPLAKRYLIDGLNLLALVINRLGPIAIWLRWSKWYLGVKTFSITRIEAGEGQLCWKFRGSLTGNEIRDFKIEVDTTLAEYPDIVFDFGDVNWIDTHGMGKILLLSEHIKKSGGQLTLTDGSSMLCHMLKLNGLGDLLPGRSS